MGPTDIKILIIDTVSTIYMHANELNWIIWNISECITKKYKLQVACPLWKKNKFDSQIQK